MTLFLGISLIACNQISCTELNLFQYIFALSVSQGKGFFPDKIKSVTVDNQFIIIVLI